MKTTDEGIRKRLEKEKVLAKLDFRIWASKMVEDSFEGKKINSTTS